MSGVQVFNGVVMAAGAALGLVLGVVCIIYLFYLGDAPQLRDEFPILVLLSGGFWAVAATAALAWFGQSRRAAWRWLAQPLPSVPLAGIVIYLWLVL